MRVMSLSFHSRITFIIVERSAMGLSALATKSLLILQMGKFRSDFFPPLHNVLQLRLLPVQTRECHTCSNARSARRHKFPAICNFFVMEIVTQYLMFVLYVFIILHFAKFPSEYLIRSCPQQKGKNKLNDESTQLKSAQRMTMLGPGVYCGYRKTFFLLRSRIFE